MAILGRVAVIRRRMSMQRTRKPVTATLLRRGAGDDFSVTQTYAHAYLYPVDGTTGLGGEGYPSLNAQAVLYQEGEAIVPRADDRLTIPAGGNTYLIVGVHTSMNADAGYAIHALTLTDQV